MKKVTVISGIILLVMFAVVSLGRFSSLVYGQDSVEILKNPGFEDGLKGWSKERCAAKVVNNVVHNGSKAVFIDNRADKWATIFQVVKDSLQKQGKGEYTATAWVRTESGTENYTMTLEVKGTKDTLHYYYLDSKAQINADDWTKVTWTQDVSWEGDLESARLKVVDGTDGTGAVYVDDCSLVKTAQ